MRSRRSLWIAMLAAAPAACTPFKDDVSAEASAGPADAQASDAQAGPGCDPGAAFGHAVPVPGLASATGTSVSALRLSSDYLVAYFEAGGRADSAGYEDLYTAVRAAPTLPFENVAPLAGTGIDTFADEFDPTVSGDGLTLVFGRAQPGGDPVHLHYATRATTSVPFAGDQLLQGVNDLSTVEDTGPFLREDAAVLYFASTRVPEKGADLYRATAADGGFGAPVALDVLNTGFSELAPVVTPDDLTLYYASDRTDGDARGEYDIWTATRESTRDSFSTPVNVTELNSPKLDMPTFLSRDGCTIYFSSTRDGTLSVYMARKPDRGPGSEP